MPSTPVDTKGNRKESKELLRDAVICMEFENIQYFGCEGRTCLSIQFRLQESHC